jgi:hypothetical protein
MAMVQVGIVRVKTTQGLVPVPVRMRFNHGVIMGMLVMFVVIMAVFVFQRNVLVFMGVAFGEIQPQSDAHQGPGQMVRSDPVILDELGYLLFSASGGALLFHLLSKLYERTSVAITTTAAMRAPRSS